MEVRQKKTTNPAKEDKANKMKRKPMFDEAGNVLINGVKLTFERGFGFNQNINIHSPAHCIDDNKVVYLLGKQIIQYDMLTQNQKIIDQINQQQEITAFVYFKNLMLDDNIIYSIHAMNKTFPSIVGKNYSKNSTQRYVLTHLEKEEKVAQILLISENKYILVLSELEGNFKISYIDVQTKEILASESIYFKVQGMFIPEANNKSIILYTQTQLYMVNFGIEIQPIPLGFLKYLQSQNNEHIVEAISSPYLNNDILVYLITNQGNLMFVSISIANSKVVSVELIFLGEFETVNEQSEIIKKKRMPSSICSNEYSILVGYHFIEEFTLVKICPIPTDKPTLTKIPFSCPNLHKIVRMHFAHQTMSICVIVQVKQNDRFDLSIPIQSEYLRDKRQESNSKQNVLNHLQKPGKIFPIMFNMLLHDTLVQTLRSPVQSILGWMLFIKQILDIAVLPTKKLMLILSKQRKIKAIKYEHLSSTSFQRMMIWEMHFNQNDCPASFDIHPLTFNVAIGFKEGLKLFTISSQGLKPNNIQFPLKNCESVRYSKFGHKLIAGSSNQIIVINPYQNKIFHTIILGSGYNVKELAFIDRDMYIFALYANGSSGIMNCEGGKIFQVWKKQSKVMSSTYDSVFDVMVVSYTEYYTKFYRERGTQQFGVLWTYPFNVTKILVVNELGTIFMGTSMGIIRAYQWPFTDMMKFSKSFTQIQLHSSPISKLRIIHDYSLLISGAQDGSIFISKINAYCDGIAITDAQIMHSLKSNNENFINLFYLQNYMITSSAIEFGQQQTIVQLESDKADFQTQYGEIISSIEEQNQTKLKKQEKEREIKFKLQLHDKETCIEELNQKKIIVKDKINDLIKIKIREEKEEEAIKSQNIRVLYQQRDALEEEKKKLEEQFTTVQNKKRQQCQAALNQERIEWKKKQQQLLREIEVVQKQYKTAISNYECLLQEQNYEGIIYKTKMLQELDKKLEEEKEYGEKLRKTFNQIKHDNFQEEDKLKNFQQMITEIQIDTQLKNQRHTELKENEKYLTQVLAEKDKIILSEEKNVKELLSKNINNYTHQYYLKHKQEELLEKVKFLQNEIQDLDQKYNNFQNDFVSVTHQTNQLRQTIENAKIKLKEYKQKGQKSKYQLYIKNYMIKLFVDKTVQGFHDSKCLKQAFKKTLVEIIEQQPMNQSSCLNTCRTSPGQNVAEQLITPEPSNESTAIMQQSSQVRINKRDNLIKQVVNMNQLRKIDDHIRRTIMLKLNRQTVGLTCEVNQLRKQKKNLTTKIKELKYYIDDIGQIGTSKENFVNPSRVKKQKHSMHQNQTCQDQIVPVNISIIRAKPSKHLNTISNREKLLPFQIYHNNKQSKHSFHSRLLTKVDLDQSSTQLPSTLPSILKNNSISQQQSGLFNVAELEQDEIK